MGVLALGGWSVLLYGTATGNFTAIIMGFSSATAFSGMWFVKKLWQWTRENIEGGLK